MLLRRAAAPPPSSSAAARCLANNRHGRATCAPRTASTGAHDYGDDDEFYEYVARVEVKGGGRARSSSKSSSKSSSGRPSAARLAFSRSEVVVAVAVGRTAFLSCAGTCGPTSLILEDDGAWPMERSRRRAFALSGGGFGGGGGDDEDEDGDDKDDSGSFSAVFVAGSHLRLRGEARDLEVAISSAGGWPSVCWADMRWDAAVAMAKERGGSSGGGGDDEDAAASGTRSLVLRPPVPSGAGAGSGAWRCFASGVPVSIDVRLPDGSRWRGLKGKMVLDRRRGWGGRGSVGGGGGGGSNAVAAAARRRRAFARALASPPWLRSPWEA